MMTTFGRFVRELPGDAGSMDGFICATEGQVASRTITLAKKKSRVASIFSPIAILTRCLAEPLAACIRWPIWWSSVAMVFDLGFFHCRSVARLLGNLPLRGVERMNVEVDG